MAMMFGRIALAGVLSAFSIGAIAQASSAGSAGSNVPVAGRPAATYDGHQLSSRYIEMRDGTRIAIDVIRPTLGGTLVDTKLPVLWMNDPYNRRVHEGGPTAEVYPGAALALVKYGYVVAVADMRGNYASFGKAVHSNRNQWMPDAYWDAYDITEWLAAQPWSTGKIGMWGCSATGHSQWQAAATNPPHLKAIFPMSAPSEYYDWGGITRIDASPKVASPYPGAIPATDKDAVRVDEDSDGRLLAAALEQHRYNHGYGYIPYRDSISPDLAALADLKGFRPSLKVNTFANFAKIAKSGIPAYQTGNYGEDIRVKEGLFIKRANLPQPVKTILAPGSHCEWSSDFAARSGNEFNIVSEELRWFDYWLKGVPNDVLKEPSVLYYTVNARAGEAWRQAWQWPVPTARPTSFWFAAGNSAREGFLAESSPRSATAGDSYVVDYSATMADLDSKGQVYTSPQFDRDTTMTGHPLIDLWITSTAPDGDFVAWLEDVAPDGTVVRLPGSEDGRLRASHREIGVAPYNNIGLPYHRSFAADVTPLVPGEAARLNFSMAPVSWVFRKGHKVRIAIVGVAVSRRGQGGATPVLNPAPVVTFLRDAQHPSRIQLPIETPVQAQAKVRKIGGGLVATVTFPRDLDARYLADISAGAVQIGDQRAAAIERQGRKLSIRFDRAPPANSDLMLIGRFGAAYKYGPEARFEARVDIAE